MFNTTNIAGSSSASASTYGASYSRTATNHHLAPEQAGNLGYGLGRLARGGVDYLTNWWQSYWNTPSQEQLAMDKQVKIFHFRIEKFVSEFHSALNKIDKDPKNAKAHKEIESIASILETVSPPNESQDLQDFQNSKFDGLRQRISKMELPTEVVNKLKSTSPVWFQNMKSAENDSEKAQEKKLESHRVKKHGRPGKKQPVPKQKNNAEGPSISSAEAAKEKIDEKVSSNPRRVAENKKTDEQPKHASRQAPDCQTYDLTQTNSTNFFTLKTAVFSGISYNVAGIRDVNGDGIADFAIGDGSWSPVGLSDAGRVWIIYGSPNVNSVDLLNLLPSQGFVIYGVNQQDNLGISIQGLGDFNGDGNNDIALGAPNIGGVMTPHLYVIFGPLLNPIDLTTCAQKCFIVNGESINDNFGYCLAGGNDINGDNIPDLFAGAYNNPGKIIGIFGGHGPWPAQFNLTDLTGSNGFVGSPASSSFFGCPITMGKMQQNAIASFAVTARSLSPSGLTNAGTVYVFNGRNGTWPAQLNFTLDGSNNGFTAYGESNEFAGTALSIGGDFFQNGKTNIIATTQAAKVYIFDEPSPSNTPLNLGILNGTNGGIGLQGPQPTTNINWLSIALIDINNDGNLDMAIGMQNYSPTPALNMAGGILFILGQTGGLPPDFTLSSNTSFIVPGVVNGGLLGAVLANVGDINGDAREDLGVTSDTGTVYILLGQPSICPPPASTNSPTNPPTNSTTPSSSSTGAIVGGVIGGVAVIATAITIAIIWTKRTRRVPDPDKDVPNRLKANHRLKANQYFNNL